MSGPAEPRRGAICTFYSFKGGVGRSMTLANVAVALAKKNNKVLVIDWDLEAPGLEQFFAEYLIGSRRYTPGLVDLFADRQAARPPNWRDCLLHANPGVADPIAVLHAGRDDDGYVERLRSIRWDAPPDDGLGDFLEQLRAEWKSAYDFVLIDSRTGLTDVGGICAVHMPDILVALFTTTNQSINGVTDILNRTRAARADMRVDRTWLQIVPIPSRDETNSEYENAETWRRRYARQLEPFMRSWLPEKLDAKAAFDLLRVPYQAFWSFGERLPVLSEDPENPKTLAYSFELIARLLSTRLDWKEVKLGTEASGARVEQAARIAAQTEEAATRRQEALLAAEQHRAEQEQERLDAARHAILERLTKLRYALLPQSQPKAWWLLPLVAAILIGLGSFSYFTVPRFRDFLDAALVGGLAPVNAALPLVVLALGVAVLMIFATVYLYASAARNRRALERLGREQAAIQGGYGEYRGLEDSEAWNLFADRMEAIAADRMQSPARASPAGPTPAPEVERVAVSPAAPAVASPAAVVPEPSLPSRIDVFVVHGGGLASAWVKEFLPLLTLWLGEALGREPVIFDPRGDGPGGGREEALRRARCALVIVSKRLLVSPEWAGSAKELDERFAASDLAVAVLDSDELLATRAPFLTDGVPRHDFRTFALIGEGFAKSDRYVPFQMAVREVAGRLADAIERPPVVPVASA